MSFHDFDRVWFLTWTTYGTWLPGDDRGFVSPKFDQSVVERRNNLVGTEYDMGRPVLRKIAASNLKCPPIFLVFDQAAVVQQQMEETATIRGWSVVAGAILSNHMHLLVGVPGDPEPETLMRDFKSYASRSLNKLKGKPASGTWWIESGSKRKIQDEGHFENVVRYILAQDNPLLVWRAGGVSPLSSDAQTGG